MNTEVIIILIIFYNFFLNFNMFIVQNKKNISFKFTPDVTVS